MGQYCTLEGIVMSCLPSPVPCPFPALALAEKCQRQELEEQPEAHCLRGGGARGMFYAAATHAEQPKTHCLGAAKKGISPSAAMNLQLLFTVLPTVTLEPEQKRCRGWGWEGRQNGEAPPATFWWPL